MKIHKSPKIKNLIILILILTIVFNITVFSGLITYNFTKAEHPEKRYEIYNPKISGQEINITTPENKTYLEPMNGYYPATYGFENDLVGNNPDNWIVEESGGTVNIISDLNGHKNIVEIHDISSVSTTQAENKFSNTVTGIIEFWIRLNATDKGVNIWIGDEEGPNNIWIDAVRLFFEPDGWIKYQDGIMNTIMTYNADYWYHIRVDFNCSSQTFDLYIDNELKVNDGGMGGDASHLDTINFNTYTPSDDYYVYFDAVGYSWDPNYAIGDNLNEGLLLSFENNTNLNWIGYSLNNQTPKTIIGNASISFPPYDGLHTIQIFGNDSLGTNFQSNIRYFEIDTSPPIITINNPEHFQFFGVISPQLFNISIEESHLVSMWYTVDSGITNITITELTGSINQTEWNKLGNGTSTINFYAIDSGGYMGHNEIKIRKDINNPTSMLFFIPHSGIDVVNESTTFSINAEDGLGSGVSIIRYKINDSSWNNYLGPFDLSSYAYGYYNISYYTIDVVGNNEEEKSTIVQLVEIPSEIPPGIPGYSLLILVSVLGVVSAIILKKRIKFNSI